MNYSGDDSKDLIKLLIDDFESQGIDAYPIATKKGACEKPYVVIKPSGSNPIYGISSEQHFLDFICYTPQFKYFELSKLKKEVKRILAEDFYPRLMPTGQETQDFFDEEIKATMSSIMYRNNVYNKHL